MIIRTLANILPELRDFALVMAVIWSGLAILGTAMVGDRLDPYSTLQKAYYTLLLLTLVGNDSGAACTRMPTPICAVRASVGTWEDTDCIIMAQRIRRALVCRQTRRHFHAFDAVPKAKTCLYRSH